MNRYRPLLLLIAAALLIAAPGFGQMAISTKAGLINLADGEVYVDGKLVAPKPTEFVTIPKEGLLKTAEGRTEVLLTPGSFLRMADYGSFRLMENDLSNVVVDLIEGAALVEVTELNDETKITLKAQEQIIRLKKNGIYLVEITPEARVRVYGNGEADVAVNDEVFTVKGSRELVASAGGWTVNKFDSKDTDPLYRWAMRRSEYIAMANLSAARTAPRPGMSSFGSMGLWGAMPGGWFFNPYFGTMTYVPWGSNVFSPFGFAYFNPVSAYRFYTMPRPVYGGSGSGWQGPGGGSQGRWSAASGPMVRGGDSGFGSYRGATSGGFGGMSSGGGGSVGGGSVSAAPSGGAASSGAAASGGGGGRGGRGQ
jgi:hypothetical protein